MTQYDELRAIHVEIRVLQYKVAALLKEKNSKGGHLYNIFGFGSSSSSQKNSSSNRALSLSVILDSFNSSQSTDNTLHSQGRGSNPGKTEALSPTMVMGGERVRSKRRGLIYRKGYRKMPRERKSFVRKMVDDIANKTLREEKVTPVCSFFRLSRDEVEAIVSRIEKYKLNNIAESRTV